MRKPLHPSNEIKNRRKTLPRAPILGGRPNRCTPHALRNLAVNSLRPRRFGDIFVNGAAQAARYFLRIFFAEPDGSRRFATKEAAWSASHGFFLKSRRLAPKPLT